MDIDSRKRKRTEFEYRLCKKSKLRDSAIPRDTRRTPEKDKDPVQNKAACLLKQVFNYSDGANSGEAIDLKAKRKANNNPDSGEAVHQKAKRKASDDGEVPQKKMKTAREDTCTTDTDRGLQTLTEEDMVYILGSSGITNRTHFDMTYTELEPLGSGNFGSVYSGLRKSDSLPVAIKHIPMESVRHELVTFNGRKYRVIREVALLLRAAGLHHGQVGKSATVSLLNWYTLREELILVMEKPRDCVDLDKYVQQRGGYLPESEAKIIFQQLVDAFIELHSKNVFHRDIKAMNVLIQRQDGNIRVRLIDFGVGSFQTEAFDYFSGTRIYAPPEWFKWGTYQPRPCTVWQLGCLLYSILPRYRHFTTPAFLRGRIKINQSLSKGCRDLLSMCLNKDPRSRATLEDLQQHPVLLYSFLQ